MMDQTVGLESTLCQKPVYSENYKIQELGQYGLIHNIYIYYPQ
jgi:hypothetical protein